MSDGSKVRVLVIDDSALMRKLIPRILARDPDIEVVGTAMDGSFGLKKIEELRPHVITLDLEMPRMDGMEALRQITRNYRLPVVVVSAHSVNGAAATFKALQLGAFDFVPKPFDASQAKMEGVAEALVEKVKIAARYGTKGTMPLRETAKVQKPITRLNAAPTKVIAIGISTGGPNALQHLLSELPGDFSGALVIVQHMPEGFTDMFARRLHECCAIDVREARSGDVLVAGRALICPGNRHMRVRRMPLGDVVVLSDDNRVNGHRPSVDVLFQSVAKEFGPKSIGLLMTGMGEDGAEGLGAIKKSGGLTLAQDEHSCVVFGMPKAGIDRGHVMRVVPLDALPNVLVRNCSAPSRSSATAGVNG